MSTLAYERAASHSGVLDLVLRTVVRALVYVGVYRIFGHGPIGYLLVALVASGVGLVLYRRSARRHRK